jgi:cobalamin synthase
LLPLIGLITGLPGAVLLMAADVVPPGVAATLALGAVLLAAGLHHADGVLDVGDAIMAHGGPDRRREVLRDTRVGIGGLCALFLVYAPTVGALAALCATSPWRAALALFAGEVAARSAMLLVLVFGGPADLRSSSVPFVRALSGPRRIPAVVVALLVPLPFLPRAARRPGCTANRARCLTDIRSDVWWDRWRYSRGYRGGVPRLGTGRALGDDLAPGSRGPDFGTSSLSGSWLPPVTLTLPLPPEPRL